MISFILVLAIIGVAHSATQFCQPFTENVLDPAAMPLISPQFQVRLEGTYNESKTVVSFLIHYDPIRMKASLSETKLDSNARQILNYITNEIYIIRGICLLLCYFFFKDLKLNSIQIKEKVAQPKS